MSACPQEERVFWRPPDRRPDLLEVLRDGAWHDLAELRAVAFDPCGWLALLVEDGHEIEERHGAYRLLG